MHVEEDDPVTVICDAAIKQRACLIVTGTRGRGPLRAQLFGSVSTGLVQRADRPVVLVSSHAGAAVGRAPCRDRRRSRRHSMARLRLTASVDRKHERIARPLRPVRNRVSGCGCLMPCGIPRLDDRVSWPRRTCIVERVWGYPRPPAVVPCERVVRVELGGEVIAESGRALRVLETSHPPTIYVPPADVRAELLVPSAVARHGVRVQGRGALPGRRGRRPPRDSGRVELPEAGGRLQGAARPPCRSSPAASTRPGLTASASRRSRATSTAVGSRPSSSGRSRVRQARWAGSAGAPGHAGGGTGERQDALYPARPHLVPREGAMRRIIVAAAAAVVISGLVAGPAVAKPRWGAGPPAGSVVDVAVAASGGGAPGRQPLRLRPARAGGHRHRAGAGSPTSRSASPCSRRTTARSCGSCRSHRHGARQRGGRARRPPSPRSASTQIKNVLLYHVVAGRKLGPLQVLFSRSLTMANGGIVKPRGITLRDETPALRDPRLVLSGRSTSGRPTA